MDAADWAPLYAGILQEFGWTESADRRAAETLHDLLPPQDRWKHVGTELKHRRAVTVVGAGPALERLTTTDFPAGVVVAADGAAERLRELGIVPRVVVTDLDGDPDALRWAAAQGAAMVVHAHGDNRDRLAMVAELGPFVCGTYQSTPDPALAPLHNLGGFTDGDRAVVLCEAYDVRVVSLVAFDFEAEPSRYSHTWDPATKPRKLAWAKRIIEGVHGRGRTHVQLWTPPTPPTQKGP